MIPAKYYWSPTKKLMVLGAMAGAGALVEDTATGNPVVFTTDLSKPLRRLALSLLPRQSGSGDPSPSNIRPLLPLGEVGTWTGGKNLLQNKINTMSPTTVMIGQDEAYTKAQKTFLKAGTYTLSYDISVNAFAYYRNPDNSVKGRSKEVTDRAFTFTLLSDDWFAFWFYSGNGITAQDVKSFQLEAGEQATAYEPYTGQSYPVNLQKNLLNFSNVSFPQTLQSYIFTKNQDGSITATYVGGASENSVLYLVQGGTADNPIIPSGQYTWSVFPANSGLSSSNTTAQVTINDKETGSVAYRRQLRTNVDKVTFTLTDEQYVSDAFIRIDKSETATVTFKLMLEEGDTATDFQPYIPPVYGGYVDLLTGEVWGTKGYALLNDPDKWDEVTGKNIEFQYNEEFDRKITSDSYTGLDCTIAVAKSVNNKPYCRWMSASTKYFGFKNGANAPTPLTLSDVKTMAEAGQIAITYDIEPVLLATLTPQQVNAIVGVNTVWSDADGVEVTYLKKG